MVPEIDGVWAVTRHEDISYVSKNPDLFCSSKGVQIEAVPEDILDAAQSFLGMDGAKHSSLRRLVSSVFTPGRSPRSRIRSRPRRLGWSTNC